MDRREAIAEIKQKIGVKWKLKFLMSEKMERIQETFFEVWKMDSYGEYDRASFSALNQILCVQSRLNGHQAKINQNQSELCAECKVADTFEHFIFDCDRYVGGRKELEESVENILAREGMNCSTIDMKVLSGNIAGLNKEARSELVGALLNFIKCTKRFN